MMMCGCGLVMAQPHKLGGCKTLNLLTRQLLLLLSDLLQLHPLSEYPSPLIKYANARELLPFLLLL